MKATSPIAMEYIVAGNRKLLVGRIEERIEPDSYIVFHRIEDSYWLQVIQQSGNQTDPSSSASFLPVELVDANERVHAVSIAMQQRQESQVAIAKPKQKRKTVRQQPPGSVPAGSGDKSPTKPKKRSSGAVRRVGGEEQ